MVWHASTSTHCWAEEWPQTVENEECARPSQALQEDPLWISTKILSGQSMAVDDVMGWNKTFDESKILARIAWLILLAFILEGLLYAIIRRTVIRFIRLVGHGQQIQIVFITCKHAFTLTHTHTHTTDMQVGRVESGPADYYSSWLPGKQRRHTLVDELLASEESRRYHKNKYLQLQSKFSSGTKRLKNIKHKRKYKS